MDSYSIEIIWQAIILSLLIMLSAYFSGFEAAVTSVNKFQLKTYYKNKKEASIPYKISLFFIDHFQMTMSALLTGNNLVAVASSVVSTLLFTNICLKSGVGNVESVATGLSTGITTLLLLAFGEFIPKSFARKYNIQYLRYTYYIGLFFYFLFWPISWLLNLLVYKKMQNQITEADLHSLVSVINQEGELGAREASLIKNAISFDDTKITSIMTNKKYIQSIDASLKTTTIAKKFIDNKYSRFPVIKNNKYIGMVTAKSFFCKYYETNGKFELDEIIQPIIEVSQYTSLDELLQIMQVNQCHMAIVKKNNHSSTIVGLATLENIIEYLVGKIYDEDDSQLQVAKINNFTYRVLSNYDAKVFFDKYFNTKINFEGTIADWFREEFKVNLKNNLKKSNQEWKISINKTTNKGLFFVVIEKRNDEI